jgi:H+-transporting ATPase
LRVKMLTGDNIFIAKHISSILKIGSNIISAAKIFKKKEKDENLYRTVLNADGFSEVFPEHKFKIIQVLQGHGHLVAMTGDGVNDAPALKEANCGIAVSGATDAARAAASVVLLAPGLSVIVDAVKEARRVFQRMMNYAIYRISETIRVLLFMTLSIVVFNFYPVTALMIALLAILNDIPILTISLDNVEETKSPVDWNFHGLFVLTTFLGVAGVLSTFSLFYIVKDILKLSLPLIQTAIFLKLVVAGHSTVFVTRSRSNFWKRPFPSKSLLLAILATDVTATLFSVYGILLAPIGWNLALFIWAYAIAWMFFNDWVKVLVLKHVKIEKEKI